MRYSAFHPAVTMRKFKLGDLVDRSIYVRFTHAVRLFGPPDPVYKVFDKGIGVYLGVL